MGRSGDPHRPTLIATVLGSSMAFVDATVVNVALPTIGGELGLSLAGRQWVFLAYSLAVASLYLAAGGIADRVGLRRTFLAGVAAFAVTSALAGAAPDGSVLIAARAMQGAAGALLITASLALLRSTYGAQSGRAVGTWTAGTGLAVLLGPPLGGVIVEHASWRLIFLLNLPVAALVLVLERRRAGPDPAPIEPRPFDLPGAALLAVGLAGLSYALVEGAERGVGAVWWAIVAAAAGGVGSALHAVRSAHPLLPPVLLRKREFAAANAVTLLVYAALGGSSFVLVLYLQSVLAYSPLEASLVLVPMSLALLLLATRFGRLADRIGPRPLLVAGPLLLGAGILALAFVSGRERFWLLALGVAAFSLGLAVTVAPVTATALAAAPPRFAGVAAGVNNTVSRTGSLLAVALLGLVVSAVYDDRAGGSELRPLTEPVRTAAERAASVDGYRAAMLVAAALAVAAAVVAALGLPRARRAGSDVG